MHGPLAETNQQEQYITSASMSHATGAERLAFLRKVYSLLFSGIFVFFLCTAIPIALYLAGTAVGESIVSALLSINPLVYIVAVLGMSFLAGAVAHKPGINIVMFYVFAAFFGVLTVPLVLYAMVVTAEAGALESGQLAVASGLTAVLQAAGLTTLIMGGLTAYVFITKKDFSFMGGFLAVGLVLLIGAAIIMAISSMMGANVEMFHTAFSIVAVILFSGYVLYDTSRILHHFPSHMWVAAALHLLIDFIILFRNILWLILQSRR